MALEQPVTIINKLGLHARAAAKLVTCASGFKSEVLLRRGKQQVNAKSIMGVMMLAASKGTDLLIVATGDDEAEAVAGLLELIRQRFGEES